VNECKQCRRFRDRLVKVVTATRACLKAYKADEDTVEAYAELRREGERIDRMMQRVTARERREMQAKEAKR